MSRWYDKRPRLKAGLDKFKEMDQEIREPLLNDIINLVTQLQPELLSTEQVDSFHFDSYCLRWYDHDPHCWLVFNILEIADVTTLVAVEKYFDNKRLLAA